MVSPSQSHSVHSLESLINRWFQALASYGTPSDFADTLMVERLHNPENLSESSLILLRTERYSRRAELMAQQKRKQEARAIQGHTARWPHDGDLDCFLCDNIGRAQARGDNLVLPWDYEPAGALVPNKYPAFNPHLLFVRKEHDPSPQKIGLSVTGSYLESMVRFGDEYGLCSLRNHARAGMSIPNHEHYHLYPSRIKLPDGEGDGEELPMLGILDSSRETSRYGKDIWSPRDSRFDTLGFRGKKAVETVMSVLGRLEADKVVFTFIYGERTFLVTPHRSDVFPDSRGQFGGSGNPAYFSIAQPAQEVTFASYMSENERFHFPRGTFSWEKYL